MPPRKKAKSQKLSNIVEVSLTDRDLERLDKHVGIRTNFIRKLVIRELDMLDGATYRKQWMKLADEAVYYLVSTNDPITNKPRTPAELETQIRLNGTTIREDVKEFLPEGGVIYSVEEEIENHIRNRIKEITEQRQLQF